MLAIAGQNAVREPGTLRGTQANKYSASSFLQIKDNSFIICKKELSNYKM